jgi:phosphoribosyl-dephospho-CoA transferase
MAERALRRHDLVRADSAAWATMLAARADLAVLPDVAEWALQRRPLIARRSSDGDVAGEVALGLPLPPSAGKLRLSFTLPMDAVGAIEPPPLLSVAAMSAPAEWQDALGWAIALAPDVRVFGALAWQALTGLTYLSETSDVDLLWPLPAIDQVDLLLEAIAAIEADAPMRLDGELVRRDGAAANWRELASRSDDVLVKRLDGVSLQRRTAFLKACA